MRLRRCVVCLLVLADHREELLRLHGYAPHRFDPGERRRADRRQVQSVKRRRVS